MIETFGPELQLLTACCRFPPTAAASNAIAAAGAATIDWALFEALIDRHRVAGLVSSNIGHVGERVPADVRDRIAAAARTHAAADLRMAAETARLQQAFDKARLPALFLKGAPLGMLAFDRLGLKQSWDVDLLTQPHNMIAAFRVLEEQGYRLVEPQGLSEESLQRFARFAHEAKFNNAANITVELHWRLSLPHILAGADPFADAQGVQIAGQCVMTLRDELLFAFLVAHGQLHGWTRMKWLADLAAFLTKVGPAETARLYGEAGMLGVGRSASAALLLCADLLGLELSPELRRRCAADRAVRHLLKADLDCIAHPVNAGEVPMLSPIHLTLVRSRLRCEPGWRNLLAELRTHWTQPLARAKYPNRLDFAYHLLRLPIWLVRVPGLLVRLALANRPASPDQQH